MTLEGGLDWLNRHMDLVWVTAGLSFLVVGGQLLIRGATAVAQKLKLSNLVIGITVIGFGTALPELMVGLQAAFRGTPDILIGNVVGSVIANILLILGIGAFLRPINAQNPAIQRDVAVMIVATIALLVLAYRGGVDYWDARILLASLGIYLLAVYLLERRSSAPVHAVDMAPVRMGLVLAMAFISVGIFALLIGADSIIRGATGVARTLGISDAVIGLTLVALGTALPELAITIIAALKRQNDLALGNIIGSNIFNIAGILGVTGLISPIPISDHFTNLDIPIAIGVSVILGFLVYALGNIGRLCAIIFLVAYGTYLFLLLGM